MVTLVLSEIQSKFILELKMFIIVVLPHKGGGRFCPLLGTFLIAQKQRQGLRTPTFVA